MRFGKKPTSGLKLKYACRVVHRNDVPSMVNHVHWNCIRQNETLRTRRTLLSQLRLRPLHQPRGVQAFTLSQTQSARDRIDRDEGAGNFPALFERHKHRVTHADELGNFFASHPGVRLRRHDSNVRSLIIDIVLNVSPRYDFSWHVSYVSFSLRRLGRSPLPSSSAVINSRPLPKPRSFTVPTRPRKPRYMKADMEAQGNSVVYMRQYPNGEANFTPDIVRMQQQGVGLLTFRLPTSTWSAGC